MVFVLLKTSSYRNKCRGINVYIINKAFADMEYIYLSYKCYQIVNISKYILCLCGAVNWSLDSVDGERGSNPRSRPKIYNWVAPFTVSIYTPCQPLPN